MPSLAFGAGIYGATRMVGCQGNPALDGMAVGVGLAGSGKMGVAKAGKAAAKVAEKLKGVIW